MSKYNPVISVRLTENLLKNLDEWAEKNSLSRSAAINYLLARKLADELRISNSEASEKD